MGGTAFIGISKPVIKALSLIHIFQQVEKDMEGVYLKVPDEVTEEKCDVCGRNMVVKSGRFGRFLACPGYPECTFTKPLVVEMPGRCPKCGGRLMKRTGVSKKTGKQYTYCLLYTSLRPACQRTPAFMRRKQGFCCNLWKNKRVSAGKWSPSNSNLPAFSDSWLHISA